MNKAIYALSGDPITYGHIDIIKRAAKVFDQLIVAIGVNPSKNYMFSLEERTQMAKKSLARLKNIQVLAFEGLLVDFAWEKDASIIIKGVRSAKDFEYEHTLHQMSDSQQLGIDTHVLFANPKLAHVSSSAVKAIQKDQGLIHEYVPLYVKKYLEEKISQQYIVGITGEIGAGKTYVAQKLVEHAQAAGIPAHHIELDQIGHQILEKLDEPKYQEIRNTLVEYFGKKIKKKTGKINRKVLGEIVFNDHQKLERLNKIMYTPMLVRLRRELYRKKGLIVFNAALIAESDMIYLCNNNVILVKVDKKLQEKRLAQRQLSKEQIKRRLSSQYDFKKKKESIETAIKKDGCGKAWVIESSTDESTDTTRKLFKQVVKELGINKAQT